MTANSGDRALGPRRRIGALSRLLFAFTLYALTMLTASAQDIAAEEAEPVTQRSEFQRLLDAHGIPLTLPPRGKAILVNIPAFELIALQDAAPVFRSRVIVGAPWHRTPRLETHVTSVRIRPTWRPTPSMVASGEYRDRIWPSGPTNPLGLAAVRFEPDLLIYLHDTNRRELFAEEMRALSHGCIRVQQWDDLVAWVLNMPLQTVHGLANGNKTLDLPADPIPVYLAYYLRFPDDTGTLIEHPDVYGLSQSNAIASSEIQLSQGHLSCAGLGPT
ncbi:L,D-transpeptidase family protein [Yoonia sediminilitoris]|nr:L,D-transpeptidase family protein [Yoonia sediminilitoris]